MQNAPGWSDGPKDAMVIGAGGTARAVLVALRRSDGGTVHVLNRTLANAQALVEEIDGPFEAHGFEAFAELAPRIGLVVNTSSIGMHGTKFDWLDLSLLPPDTLVTDIVYVPLDHAAARRRPGAGLTTVDGLGMLLHQAVPGFEAWFGVRPEVTPELRRLDRGDALMWKLGLTGSIATGKSTVLKQFAELGVPIFSSDDAVHELYRGDAVPPVEALFPGVSQQRRRSTARSCRSDSSASAGTA